MCLSWGTSECAPSLLRGRGVSDRHSTRTRYSTREVVGIILTNADGAAGALDDMFVFLVLLLFLLLWLLLMFSSCTLRARTISYFLSRVCPPHAASCVAGSATAPMAALTVFFVLVVSSGLEPPWYFLQPLHGDYRLIID